jgi:hypothetical protein
MKKLFFLIWLGVNSVFGDNLGWKIRWVLHDKPQPARELDFPVIHKVSKALLYKDDRLTITTTGFIVDGV